jgi:antitoxin (DNA-binding transcriptional repressor) of toxin-antitoxin stability system
MLTVNVHAAKTHFSRVVDQAAAGEGDHHCQSGQTRRQAGAARVVA